MLHNNTTKDGPNGGSNNFTNSILRGSRQQQDESMDFDDLMMNDSSRVGLVGNTHTNRLNASYKINHQDDFENSNNFKQNFNNIPMTNEESQRFNMMRESQQNLGGAGGGSRLQQRRSMMQIAIPLNDARVVKEHQEMMMRAMAEEQDQHITPGYNQEERASQRNSNKMGAESENFDDDTPSAQHNNGNYNQQNSRRSYQNNQYQNDGEISQRHQPIIAPGELNENINKRSESANRKYRAFKHFLKYQNKNQPTKSGKFSSTMLPANLTMDQTKVADQTMGGLIDYQNNETKLPQLDELSASDADDDFDDRYIHLIAAHSEINKACCVFQPDSSFKGCWDLLGLICIIYQAIVIPFRLCFDVEAEGGLQWLETIMDVIFMCDIVVTFNTGFYKKGYLVMKRKEIIKNYLKTWFILDLLASFPYSWAMSSDSGNDDQADDETTQNYKRNQGHTVYRTPQLLRLIRIVRFLRFLRLLRVLKLKKLLYKFEEIIMSDTINAILGFFKVITVILFIAHWIACIFYYIGESQLDTEPICWLTMANIQDAPTFDKYIISLYWAFTTMTTVGYGDVSPYTMSEKIYAMFSMLIACGVFAYVVGSIETIARRSNTMAAIFKEKILHVNQFLMHKQIPKYLRLKVRRYLEYMFEYKKQYKLSEIEVLQMLNENLKDQVIVHLNGRMLKNTRIFGIFDFRFLSEVTFLLLNETFSMDDHIFEEDEKGTKMYFITKGTVVIMQKKSHTYIKELQVDEYFGEISFFSDLNRQATARSRGFTEVLSLSKDLFVKTADQQYPEAAKTYKQIEERLSNYTDYNAIFVTCYLCGKQGHISVHCEEQFPEIEGNLKKQIFKMKQKLIKMQKQQQLKNNDKLLDGSQVDIDKSKAQNNDEDEKTEEIKTEMTLHSDESSDEQSSSSSGGDKSKSASRRNSNQSNQPSQMNNAYMKGINGLSPDQRPRGFGPGGGFRLNVNVGASTIETAEKFKKIDAEIQKQNNTQMEQSDVEQINAKKQEIVPREINPTKENQQQQIEQDIPQELPKLDQQKSKQIKSMLLGIEQKSVTRKFESNRSLNQYQQQNSNEIKKPEEKRQSEIQINYSPTQPKSILKKPTQQFKESTFKSPAQQISKQRDPNTLNLNQAAIQEMMLSSSKEWTSSHASSSVDISKHSEASRQLINAQKSLKNNPSNKNIATNPSNHVLIEAKTKGYTKTFKSNKGGDDHGMPNMEPMSKKVQSSKVSNKSNHQSKRQSDTSHGLAKLRSKDSSNNFDAFMKKDLSPFKMNFNEIDQRGINIPSFLPSLNDHKNQILHGANNNHQPLLHKEHSIDPQKRPSGFQRSGTQLLGQIKEVGRKSNKGDGSQAGVVPKDLGFGLLKDLIDEIDDEEDLSQDGESRKNKPLKKQPVKRKSTVKNPQEKY